jgi:import receptor subunit TOM22
VNYGGKSLWVIATSILLLGIPYALALGEEQQYMEEERQRGMMEQGAQGMMQPGQGEAKPAL